MRHDFRGDVPSVHDWLRGAAEQYRARHLQSPSEFPVLTRVELAFLVGQPNAPTLYLDLDARPDAEADGDATFRSVAELARPDWRPFLSPPAGDRHLVATFPDGSTEQATTDEVDGLLGRALAALLLSARDAGVFDSMPAVPELQLDVTYQGDRVWPPYDDEGA